MNMGASLFSCRLCSVETFIVDRHSFQVVFHLKVVLLIRCTHFCLFFSKWCSQKHVKAGDPALLLGQRAGSAAQSVWWVEAGFSLAGWGLSDRAPVRGTDGALLCWPAGKRGWRRPRRAVSVGRYLRGKTAGETVPESGERKLPRTC